MKGTIMTTRILLGSSLMMLLLALPAHAGGKGELQQYFSNAAHKVKATENPSEKREILNQSLHTMSTALDMVHGSHVDFERRCRRHRPLHRCTSRETR